MKLDGSHEAIIRFSDMLIPIVQFLEDMMVNLDGNVLLKCNGLLHSILTFEFILTLEVAVEILSLIFQFLVNYKTLVWI